MYLKRLRSHECVWEEFYLPVFARLNWNVITLVKHKHYYRLKHTHMLTLTQTHIHTIDSQESSFLHRFNLVWLSYFLIYFYGILWIETTWALHCRKWLLVNNKVPIFHSFTSDWRRNQSSHWTENRFYNNSRFLSLSLSLCFLIGSVSKVLLNIVFEDYHSYSHEMRRNNSKRPLKIF